MNTARAQQPDPNAADPWDIYDPETAMRRRAQIEPEQKLALAVIVDALATIRHGGVVNRSSQRRVNTIAAERHRTVNWFRSRSDSCTAKHGMTFRWCCAALGVDPGRALAAIEREHIAPQQAGHKPKHVQLHLGNQRKRKARS